VTCSTYWEDKNLHTILVKKPGKRDHLCDLGIDRILRLSWKQGEGVDWIHLAQDRALVRTAMKLQVP
jgi:hypothetical protein